MGLFILKMLVFNYISIKFLQKTIYFNLTCRKKTLNVNLEEIIVSGSSSKDSVYYFNISVIPMKKNEQLSFAILLKNIS